MIIWEGLWPKFFLLVFFFLNELNFSIFFLLWKSNLYLLNMAWVIFFYLLKRDISIVNHMPLPYLDNDVIFNHQYYVLANISIN